MPPDRVPYRGVRTCGIIALPVGFGRASICHNGQADSWIIAKGGDGFQMPLSMGVFGGKVREAMTARAEHLADEGFARRQGQRIVLQRDLLDTLRGRQLGAVRARLSAETGLPYLQAATGEQVAGAYRQSLALTSGQFVDRRGKLTP